MTTSLVASVDPAGWVVVVAGTFLLGHFDMSGLRQALEAFRRGGGDFDAGRRLPDLLRRHGPLQRVIDLADAVRAVVHDVLEADREQDGAQRQHNVMRFITATKPAS